jgi:hypothetical protein
MCAHSSIEAVVKSQTNQINLSNDHWTWNVYRMVHDWGFHKKYENIT